MKSSHRKILKSMREDIIQDINVYNGILMPLKSEYILRIEDVQSIEGGNTEEERAEILLDILPSRGSDAFDTFRDALRNHYEWLAENMDQLERTESCCSRTPSFPPKPPITVVRNEKITQLTRAFENLQPNGYLALHGLKGFGKSCLTASTLREKELVTNLFRNEVYWIKFGYERSIDEEILIQLNRLYHLVKNSETLPEPFTTEPLRDFLIQFLKHYFSKEAHRDALLILDDVSKNEIIKTFDFECKTLVITDDLDVVRKKMPTVIKMNDGFTEAETLGLFAKVLDTDVNKLPEEAKQIHKECKGMPLLIAMFAAQFEEFKDDMRSRKDRWKYYLKSLKKKDEENKVIREFFEKQEAIFNICIEKLDSPLKEQYEKLVIFSEDVNIMPQTLEILWDMAQFLVDDKMLELCHKSLAAKQWNEEIHSYIYGVHDLLLVHLRKKVTKDQLIKMHRSFIEKYRKYCNGDFSKLPNDNYIHSYIGHHLEQAQLYDEFPNIYLNFDFVQAAIVHSGLSNLLVDLDNYEEHITKDDPAEKYKVTDLKRFLERHSSIIAEQRRKKCLDIVQLAANHSSPGYVKESAIKLAQKRTQHLYVMHEKKFGHTSIRMGEELSMKACTSCFAYDHSLMLIGNEIGETFLWDSMYKKLQIFSGHSKSHAIKKIVASENGDCFISLSESGVAKLFKLSKDEPSDEDCPQSPRQKQIFWSDIFTSKSPPDDSSAVFFVPNEKLLDITFGQNDECIVGCTNKGTMATWNRRGELLTNYDRNQDNRSCLKSIACTTKSDLIHVMDEINGRLITYCKLNDGGYKYVSSYNPALNGKKIIFFRNIPHQTDSLCIVTEEKAVCVRWFRANNDMHSYEKQERANVDGEKVVYVCAALTYDGKYIVLADSAGFINVWNAETQYQSIATYKNRVTSLDTYWVKEDNRHIICGTENRLLHKWELPIEDNHTPVRKPLFDAAVQTLGEEDTIVIETLSNSIIMWVGDKKQAETETIDGKILHLILSSDRKKIVYVTDKGVINLFDIERQEVIKDPLRVPKPVEFVRMLNIENENTVVYRECADDRLKVWRDSKKMYTVEGRIISIHEMKGNHVITTSDNEIITLWKVANATWSSVDKVTLPYITFSCLSYCKTLLAVLSDGQSRQGQDAKIVLYHLLEDVDLNFSVKIVEYFRKTFKEKLTCCEFSQDIRYLAIGFENGDISIIEVQLQEEVHKLRFHAASVTQLYWAPTIVDAPILLSLNADELVWWNISLAAYVNKQKRKSRLTINRSDSTSAIGNIEMFRYHMSTSESLDSNLHSLQRNNRTSDTSIRNGVHALSKYWKFKKGKDPNHSALLAVVDLPSNFLSKVCISNDFTKFVTVDMYGSISTFTLFGYNDAC